MIFVRYQVFDQLPVAGYAPSGYLLRIIDSTHRHIMADYEECLEHCLNYTGRGDQSEHLSFSSQREEPFYLTLFPFSVN